MSSQASIGLISNFNHQQQDWKTYKNRLNQWFIANEIGTATDTAATKKRAILLSALSEPTYQLASNLALPDELENKSFDEIVKLLDGHFIPKRCGFAERYHFYEAVQQVGEGHAQWAARLRGLAAHCNFKHLEDALLDKFVMGMTPGPEREKIFSLDISKLNLTKAVEMAENTRCARVGAAVSCSTSAAATSASDPDSVFKINKDIRATSVKCLVCGRTNHKSKECRFANYKCNKCNKKGHLRRMCTRIKYVETDEVSESEDDGELFNIRSDNGAPMYETIYINDLCFEFEVDSGSAVTAISDHFYKLHFRNMSLLPCRKKLWGYTKDFFNCLGIVKLPISYVGRTFFLEVYVIQNGGPPILGRDFISKFNLNLVPINFCGITMSAEPDSSAMYDIDKCITDYPELFSGQLGCFKKYKVRLPLKNDAKPIFFKARPIAFALKEKVDQELDRLVTLGILTPIEHSEYASPIVPVLKRDGTVRICADYSQTINKQLLVEKYPLPTIEELFSKLHGGVQYTKLDMSMAYNQLEIIDPENITCINTNRGLFKYNRLIFGLASAPAIFQRALHSILGNMDGVLVFLDDILVTGTPTQHVERLKVVLQRLRDAGLTLHKDKCAFFKDEISYLGYVINKNGIKKSQSKVKSIVQSAAPKNLSQLQSFLGLVNYYRNFIRGASSILSPLYELLNKGTQWTWEAKHDLAFDKIKKCLASEQVLTHFNPDAKIILTVDASPTGLGAILSQIEPDGSERPISFASRTLSSAEKKYAQIQKEATAIIFGVKKFHLYLYARTEPFVLRTDHKPLISIFGLHRGIPEITANRLQRYAIFLSAYNYVIEYVRSSNNIADFLSRASIEPVRSSDCSGAFTDGTQRIQSISSSPVGTSADSAGPDRGCDNVQDKAAYINFVLKGSPPVTLHELRVETSKDEVLKKVVNYVLKGWPRKTKDQSIKPYHLCRFQLSYENGCLMRGHKIVLPLALADKCLKEIHSSHFGIVKCKAEARSRFWFPGIDAAIEKLIGECNVCSKLRPSPPRVPLASWRYPSKPFQRIHLDFLGPLNDRMYLMMVDAYSKWVECYDMKGNTTSAKVIERMCEFMSRFGIPDSLISDNGTSFTSEEFKYFCSLNGITHVTTPVYHPASNGQAESCVKIVKKGIKAALLSVRNAREINNYLHKYLFDYRNSKHSFTECSPAELVFGQRLKSRLDLLSASKRSTSTPDLTSIVQHKQSLQNKYFHGTKRSSLSTGDKIMYKHYINKNKFTWKEGEIVKQLGTVLYVIRDVATNKHIKRHINQILKHGKPSTAKNQIPDGNQADSQPSRSTSEFQPIANLLQENSTPSSRGSIVADAEPRLGAVQREATTSVTSSSNVPIRPFHMQLRNLPRVDYKKFF